MKQATVRDLRCNWDRVAAWLESGEEIEITKRNKVVARLLPPELLPPSPKATRPKIDFLGRLKKIYGDKVLEVSGAALLAQERDRY